MFLFLSMVMSTCQFTKQGVVKKGLQGQGLRRENDAIKDVQSSCGNMIRNQGFHYKSCITAIKGSTSVSPLLPYERLARSPCKRDTSAGTS